MTERDICYGCGQPDGEAHDEECLAAEHQAMLAGDEMATAVHDPEGCEACLAGHAVASSCRCGVCCESLLIEASEFDAQREPRIRQLGSPYRDQLAYLLNGPGGPCVFFSRDASGRGVCAIYDTRPLGCRVFDCDREGREQLIELGILTRPA